MQTLTNGRLTDGSLVDIEVGDGRIASITAAASVPTGHTIDLEGWLVLPALGEPHAHLDKALTAELVPNPSGDLGGAIAAWTQAAAGLSAENIVERASAALGRLAISGATGVRSHVNCGGEFGARAIEAMIEVRSRFEETLHLQLVALPSRPLNGADGAANRASLEAAIAAGFDLVGGAPHLDADGEAATRYCLETARDAGLALDLHTDETLDPNMALLSYLARLVIDTAFPYAVTASHCVSLGAQPESIQHETAALVAEAGIGIVTLPQTNLFLQGRGMRVNPPRGLTAIAALQEAGVKVAAGADNLQDPFNTVGRADPLETAALMVMAGHLDPLDAFESVSSSVRYVLGLEPLAVVVGSSADLLVIDSPTIRAAVADAPASRKVFHRGRLVAARRTEGGLT